MIKLVSFSIAILLVSVKCIQQHGHSIRDHNIRAVHIAGSIPVVTPDTSYAIRNSYDIFYYDDLVAYKFEYSFDSIVNGKILLREFRPNFFVFHKDSLFGYSYYPPPNTTTKEDRVSIDTMFARNAYEPFKFDSTFTHKPDSLYFDKEKNLVKVYNTSASIRYPEKFTYYLYYSKELAGLNDGFFSRSMDDEGGMKLFRIRIVALGHYYEEYKMTFPQREFLYEMKKVPVKDTAEIMGYFDKYKKNVLRGF